MAIERVGGRPFVANKYTKDITSDYEPIPGPLSDEVVLIMNPRNRIGPKHVYTPESFPRSKCGSFNFEGISTTTLRVSANVEDCHEIVGVNDFDPSDDVLCQKCANALDDTWD